MVGAVVFVLAALLLAATSTAYLVIGAVADARASRAEQRRQTRSTRS